MLFDAFFGMPMYSDYLYNCTGTSSYTEKKVFIGVMYMLIGPISQFLYALILFSIRKKKSLFSLPCYKIMFFLGITDVLCLFICADFAGIYAILGLHPCFSMNFTYITGCLVFGLWHMSCLYVLLLAFNRVLELIAPRICAKIFNGPSLIIMICMPVIYFIYFTFFTKPTFFQPSYNAFLLNPMTNVTSSFPSDLYTVEAYVFNNFFVMFFIGICYIIICSYLIYKNSTSKLKQTSDLVKKVSYQCLIICTCHFIGCFLYVYIQYFWLPDFLNILCHLAWIGNHSLPPYVYLIYNPTIRKDILNFLYTNSNIERSEASKGDIKFVIPSRN